MARAVLETTRRVLLLGALAGVGAAEATPRFARQLEVFHKDDADGPSPAGALLFVGSSTIRLWPHLDRTFAPRPVVQRGVGGATLAEVARHRRLLFAPHRPGAVVLYAGENDIVAGASPVVVVARFVELRRALAETPAGTAPWILIAAKPSPARWAHWPAMHAANARLAALPRGLAAEHLVRPAAWLLRGGGRPDPGLFRPDGLHFNQAGYARLTAELASALAAIEATPRDRAAENR